MDSTTDNGAGMRAATDRITGLDVTRGFAVMGILAMNIVAFAMPGNAYVSPRAWGGDTGPDLWVWAFNYVLLDSKMRGLFSMMFGASTLLVIQSASAAGRSPARTHYGRMIVLALFGLAHFFLIWFGDILFLYAMCGMLLYAFRNLSIPALRRWAVGFFTIATLFTLQFVLLAVPTMPGLPAALTAELVKAHDEVTESMTRASDDNQEELDLYRSDFATIVSQNVREDWADPLVGVLMFGPETLALMLIGMIMFKSGLLRGTWSLDRLDRWRNWCLGIGLVANLLLLWWQFASGLDPVILLLCTFGVSVPFDFIMSIGFAALFMGLAQRFAGSALIARFAATGRAAFTNYLGTSLVMTFIFYGWGLGQFGSWSRFGIYGLVVAAWVVMLLWSKPWLDRYLYGPLEWLWRSLARGTMQPMRRTVVVH
jgi:uncharacterized protein